MSHPPPLMLDHPNWLLGGAELQEEGEHENPDPAAEAHPVMDPEAVAPAPEGDTGQVSAPKTKKRRRPALSCEQCRRRKIRCDRGLPCVNCIKSNISPCTYAPTHIPASRMRKAVTARGLPRRPPRCRPGRPPCLTLRRRTFCSPSLRRRACRRRRVLRWAARRRRAWSMRWRRG